MWLRAPERDRPLALVGLTGCAHHVKGISRTRFAIRATVIGAICATVRRACFIFARTFVLIFVDVVTAKSEWSSPLLSPLLVIAVVWFCAALIVPDDSLPGEQTKYRTMPHHQSPLRARTSVSFDLASGYVFRVEITRIKKKNTVHFLPEGQAKELVWIAAADIVGKESCRQDTCEQWVRLSAKRSFAVKIDGDATLDFSNDTFAKGYYYR